MALHLRQGLRQLPSPLTGVRLQRVARGCQRAPSCLLRQHRWCNQHAVSVAIAAARGSDSHSRNSCCIISSLAGASAALAAACAFQADAECQSSGRGVRDPSTLAAVMYRSIFQGDVRGCQQAIEAGADPNFRHAAGWQPIHVAASLGRHDIVDILLKHGADVNSQDEYEPSSAQHILVRQADFPAVTNPAMGTQGFTPLHYAVIADRKSTVKLLLQHMADPTIKSSEGELPKDLAESADIRNLLLEYERHYTDLQEERVRQHEAKKRQKRRAFPLEKRLRQWIVGQDGPIMALSSTVRRWESGWHDDEHPLVFLFLGSSGVGKTELAKRLAEYLYNDEGEEESVPPTPEKSSASADGSLNRRRRQAAKVDKGFIRLDMSEYQEKHEVAKLIGSPPGYVGHDDGGQLVNMLRDNPKAVVLLDEIEKAHADVLTVLLQLFDEGRLTDGKGQTIDCREAIFIMTSNLASDVIAEHAMQLRQQAEDMKEGEDSVSITQEFKDQVIRPILKYHFKRDEFLGRIDEILYFVPFSKSELRQLVSMELEKWSEKAKRRHNIGLQWDESVVDDLVQDYDVHYGARSLQHAVNIKIINQLALAHEQGKLVGGHKFRVVYRDGSLCFEDLGQDSPTSASKRGFLGLF